MYTKQENFYYVQVVIVKSNQIVLEAIERLFNKLEKGKDQVCLISQLLKQCKSKHQIHPSSHSGQIFKNLFLGGN